VLQAELNAVREFEILSKAGVLKSVCGLVSGIVCAHAMRGVRCWSGNLSRVSCAEMTATSRRGSRCCSQRSAKCRRSIFIMECLTGAICLKDLPSDVNLAKDAMERDYLARVCGLPTEQFVIGAPSPLHLGSEDRRNSSWRIDDLVFGTIRGFRHARRGRISRTPTATVPLSSRKRLWLHIELHPFESRSRWSRTVWDVASPEDVKLEIVLDGPLSRDLFSQAW
jgi:hypothetical protein